MKKLIIGVIAGAQCLGVFGQGTVHFNNHVPGAVDAKFFMPGGSKGVSGLSAQILAGPVGSSSGSLQPVYPATTFRTGAAAGYVVPIDVVIPGLLPGERATMVVRIFCGDVFEQSWQYAVTNPITITLGGGLLPPANMVGLQSVAVFASCVPEPSTFVLVSLAAVCVGIFPTAQRRG